MAGGIGGSVLEAVLLHAMGKSKEGSSKSGASLKSERHTGIGSLLREHVGNRAAEEFGFLGKYVQHRLTLPAETKFKKILHRDIRGLSSSAAIKAGGKEEKSGLDNLAKVIQQGFESIRKAQQDSSDKVEKGLRDVYTEIDRLGLKQKRPSKGKGGGVFGTDVKEGKAPEGWLDKLAGLLKDGLILRALGLGVGGLGIGGAILRGGAAVAGPAAALLFGYNIYEEFKEGRREAKEQQADPDLFKRQLQDAMDGKLPGDEGATKQKPVDMPQELHVGDLCYYADELTIDSKQKITFQSEEKNPTIKKMAPTPQGANVGSGGGHKPLHLPTPKGETPSATPTPNSTPTNSPAKAGTKHGMTPENLEKAAPKLQSMLDSGELGVSSSMANMAIPGLVGSDGKINVDVLKKSGPKLQSLMDQGLIPKDKVQQNFPELIAGSNVSENGQVVPEDVVNKAREFVNQGGSSSQLQSFMTQQGYPMRGSWCGEFMASVVKSQGGTPPKGASIATNWMKYGEGVNAKSEADLKPGDVIVYNRGLPTGSTGGHVGMVESVENGSFTELGGNQGHAVTERPGQQFDPRQMVIRRSPAPDITPPPAPQQAPTQTTTTSMTTSPPAQTFSAGEGTDNSDQSRDVDKEQGRNSFSDQMGVGGGD